MQNIHVPIRALPVQGDERYETYGSEGTPKSLGLIRRNFKLRRSQHSALMREHFRHFFYSAR